MAKVLDRNPQNNGEPKFQNQLEELEYWKNKAEEKDKECQDLEETFNEYQQSSKDLEAELERELTTNEKKLKEITSLFHRLKSEHDETAEKSRRSAEDAGKMIHNLQDELEALKKSNKDLRREKQRLEQENDELERRVREAEASLHDLTEKMNKTLEENSFLQTEFEETKNRSQETIQRMKDEMRDLQLELIVTNEGSANRDSKVNQSPKMKQNHHKSSSPPNVSHSKEGSIELVDDILSLVKDMERKLLTQKMESSSSLSLVVEENY